MNRFLPSLIAIGISTLCCLNSITAVSSDNREYSLATAEIHRLDSLISIADEQARDSLIPQLASAHAEAADICLDEDDLDPAAALRHADAGLVLPHDSATHVYLIRLKGKALEMTGTAREMKTLFDEAAPFYRQALGVLSPEGLHADCARVYVKIAKLHENNYLLDSAEHYLHVAEREARLAGNESRLFDVLSAQKKFARDYGRHSLYISSSLAFDSISNLATDEWLRRDALIDIAEGSITGGDMVRGYDFYSYILASLDTLPQSSRRDTYLTSVIDRLADLSQERGLSRDALRYTRRNIEMKKSGSTRSNLGLALCYNRMSHAYAAMKQTDSAYLYADSIRLIIPLTEQSFYQAYMHVLAGICLSRIDSLEAAAGQYQKAYEFGMLNTSVHPLLGGVLHRMGRPEEAMPHYEAYRSLMADRWGTSSTEYAKALRLVAQVKNEEGDTEGSCEDFITSLAIMQHNIREQLRFVPSGMRKGYISDLTASLAVMTPFGIRSGHVADSFTTKAYEGLLLNKGLLLATDQSTANLIARHGTPADKADYARLEHLKSRLALAEKDAALRDSVPLIFRRMVALDNRLADNCSRYGDVTAFASTGFADIASALGDNETLVDITDYTDDNGTRHYAAYIIRRDMDYPLLVPICDNGPVDSLIALSHGMMSNLHDEENGLELRRLCLDPLRPHLREGETVWLVPSGIFHSISVDALPLEGDTLVGDRYDIRRLSSARVLLSRNNKVPERLTATLYGGILYDMDADEMAMASVPEDDSDLALAFANRSPRHHSDSLVYLPYTLHEINTIQKILKGHASSRSVTGKKATEASFFSLSGRAPSILHIATHGFYFDPDDPEIAKGLQGYTDAMNLSGLAMAGGNAEWRGEELAPGTLGGLLTAADIARCDLSATSLVCLSACNTARGSAATSEGIYGLQRAFKKAGADTLVMSLWEASEIATTLFMNRFYDTLLHNGYDRYAAFTAARKAVREKYPEPFYWAGFIMVD